MNENLSKKVNIVKGCAFSENALKVENDFLGLFLVQFSSGKMTIQLKKQKHY